MLALSGSGILGSGILGSPLPQSTTGKKPTELLKEEHENVLQKLDALEVVIGHLDRKEEVFPRLKELASFFQTDFWVHFVKEEEALFPELERGDLIYIMINERGPGNNG